MNPTDAEFARAIEALRPRLDELILVGGWAHRLFRFHEWARAEAVQPLTTDDTDLLVKRDRFVPRRSDPGGANLSDLLVSAGFQEKLFGQDPSVTKYYSRESSYHVEFITDRAGSDRRRSGERDVVRLLAGVAVQRLPYLRLLEWEPWNLDLGPALGGPRASSAPTVSVVHPVAYLAQKVLTFARPDRSREKQAKDVLYLHDTLLFMSARLERLTEAWTRMRPGICKKWTTDLRSLRDAGFSAVTDRIRNAARIAQASGRTAPPDAETICSVCRFGLERVFA